MVSTPNTSSTRPGLSSNVAPSDPLSSARSKTAAAPSSALASNDKSAHVRKQVDEVAGIMQTNIGKIVERGDKLDHLQTQTGKSTTLKTRLALSLGIYLH